MRLAVLASWRGTNAKAIFDHVRLDVLRGVKPVLLIYSDAEAPVRKIAEAYGVDALYIPHRGVPARCVRGRF
jgi:phosphoribosylglycinamide formyltransferase-1